MLKSRFTVFAFLALAILAVFAVACDDNASEGSAIFAVSDINGNAPVTVTSGAGANIEMTFRWRPYLDPDLAIVEAAPHGDYEIKNYRVTWSAVTAGATVPSPREEETSIFVPVYDLVPATILVLTPAESGAVAAGTVLTANIEFTALEMGTERDAKFATKFTVTFN